MLKIPKMASLDGETIEYYFLILPSHLYQSENLIIKLKSNSELDLKENIFSDPDLYVSLDGDKPNESHNTWRSKKFGEETISISPQYLKPLSKVYLGVYCKNKCNFILNVELIEYIQIDGEKAQIFIINEQGYLKLQFETKNNYNRLEVNLMSNELNSFRAYLAEENPSIQNTLDCKPIFINGYRFTIERIYNQHYELLIENRGNAFQLLLWFRYDNDIMMMVEGRPTYEALEKGQAACYIYPIESNKKNKDIILSSTLFNGQGFIQFGGWTKISKLLINDEEKSPDKYIIISDRIIKLTYENSFRRYGENLFDTNLHFCFYAKEDTSYSINMYFFDNYEKTQNFNVLYPGITNKDILPKNSFTKYKTEYFNIKRDLNFHLVANQGNPKLYVYYPKNDNEIINKEKLQLYINSMEVLQGYKSFDGYILKITKEKNKCLTSSDIPKYGCTIMSIVECEGEIDCLYDIFYDHEPEEILMRPRITYTNVITQGEEDIYKIHIFEPKIKNIAIVIEQNTGQVILKSVSFSNNEKEKNVDILTLSYNFIANVYKLTSDHLNVTDLLGDIQLIVQGQTFASYSIYFYPFENENDNILPHKKISMTLKKGKIIKDTFIENELYKVYLYDNTKLNDNKTNLFITLVESGHIDCQLFVFKDLNDFSIQNDEISGYLWNGGFNDYIYINKKEKYYIENDILYVMITRKESSSNYGPKQISAGFYLGLTDETTPFLLDEEIEFKHFLNSKHKIQSFYYNYLSNNNDLKISLSLIYGYVNIGIKINDISYLKLNIKEQSSFTNIDKETLKSFCKINENCGVKIDIELDSQYKSTATFIIACQSSNDIPIQLKQGVVNKRSMLGGEKQHYIINTIPDPLIGVRINLLFSFGEGEIYVRKLLKSEINQKYIFPDKDNYEYLGSKINNAEEVSVLIPYSDVKNLEPCQLLVTIIGNIPYSGGTKIEYTISVSNEIKEISTDKSYRLFISKGEISIFHFYLNSNTKRLFISMTNKEEDANLYLNYGQKIPFLSDYQWKSKGAYNEYLDLSIEDEYFVSKKMTDIGGNYYLAIQAFEDCFYNLYISSLEVKIIELEERYPSACRCDTNNDICYFRYENINDVNNRFISSKELFFYIEYTYGSGKIYAKLYENSNMDKILNNLPNSENYDYSNGFSDEYLKIILKETEEKYTIDSVIVLSVQCKEKSLFDINVVPLTSDIDLSRNDRNTIPLSINRENIFYISSETGNSAKFFYHILNDENLIFTIKSYEGAANIHSFTSSEKSFRNEDELSNNYHHLSDFSIDSKEKDLFNGKVSKEYGYNNYVLFEVSPSPKCLLFIYIYFDNQINQLPLNKEVTGTFSFKDYFAYFDFFDDCEEAILTVTSQDPKNIMNVYIKENLIDQRSTSIIYSKPSPTNYDMRGKTNSFTGVTYFKLSNIPKDYRTQSIIPRVLILIRADKYIFDQKVSLLVTSSFDKYKRFNPVQSNYYRMSLETSKDETAVFTLSKKKPEDDLIIIEISTCKGDFDYQITEEEPSIKEKENHLKKVDSKVFSSNGKLIITLTNIKDKEYYFSIWNLAEMDFDGKRLKLPKLSKETEFLFFYYSIESRYYKYSVTTDIFSYKTTSDGKVIIQLPELKQRDIYGKEINFDSIFYSIAVTDNQKDYRFMESTCYLSKKYDELMIKDTNPDNISFKVNKNNNSIEIRGLKYNKKYYVNVLIRNINNNEVFTYKPMTIEINKLTYIKKGEIILFVLFFIVCSILSIIFYIKYKKNKMEINNESKMTKSQLPKSILELKSMTKVAKAKQKYTSLNEDTENLSEE